MKRILYFIFLSILLSAHVKAETPTVYTIGDSTMADYDPEVYPDQRGWAQMFKQFLTGDINIVNAARNGRSSKSFYTEGLWTVVLNKLKAGDYVFIQFGHNDEKNNGASGEIGTTPDEYKSYLEKYVTEARAKGATPILLTPVVRCYFSGNQITAKGAHNLSETGDDLNYPLAMKSVATALNVPLIDHTSLTKTLVESYGSTEAKKIIYIENDNTHLSITGGTLFARLVVQELVNQNILANYLNASPDIILNPVAIDFGNCYQSTFVSKTFTISGMDLDPSDGVININASEGFLVGKSESDSFSSSMQISYTGGNLANTTVIAHFEPAEIKAYTGTISVRVGSGEPKTINLSGNSLSMTGGVEAVVHFPLTSDATAQVTGPVSSLGQSHSGMYVKNYATITNWPQGVTSTDKAQRNSILTTPADTWPGNEIDIVSNRYIQFVVKPQPGTTLIVNNITAYVGAAGGNAMGYRVMASASEDFNDAVTLEDKPNNTSNTMVALSYNPIIQIAEDEALYLRFYPWYNFSGTAAAKYFCIQNLIIKGMVTNNIASGIENNVSNDQFKLYPNPSSGIFFLETTKIGDNSTATVYSQTGISVFQKGLASVNETLNLTFLPKGIYYLNITSENEKEVKKLIIK